MDDLGENQFSGRSTIHRSHYSNSGHHGDDGRTALLPEHMTVESAGGVLLDALTLWL